VVFIHADRPRASGPAAHNRYDTILAEQAETSEEKGEGTDAAGGQMSGVEEFAGLPPTGNIPYGDGRGAVQYPESQMCLYDSIQQETTIVTLTA
jgi:hypothetical protein